LNASLLDLSVRSASNERPGRQEGRLRHLPGQDPIDAKTAADLLKSFNLNKEILNLNRLLKTHQNKGLFGSVAVLSLLDLLQSGIWQSQL